MNLLTPEQETIKKAALTGILRALLQQNVLTPFLQKPPDRWFLPCITPGMGSRYNRYGYKFLQRVY